MPTDSFEARTEQNVIDSDGTLIISRGPLTGGSAYTRKMAMKHKKPWFHVDLHKAAFYQAVLMITNWLYDNKIEVPNVAGPRASNDLSIYDHVFSILEQVHFLSLLKEDRPELFVSDRSRNEDAPRLPATVDEAVKEMLSEMSLEDRVTMANLEDGQIHLLGNLLNEYLRSKLMQWTVNQQLFEDCKARSENPDLDDVGAAQVIVKEIWK